jgi:hypothetical protein
MRSIYIEQSNRRRALYPTLSPPLGATNRVSQVPASTSLFSFFLLLVFHMSTSVIIDSFNALLIFCLVLTSYRDIFRDAETVNWQANASHSEHVRGGDITMHILSSL